MELEYPTILRRYFSTFIDGIFVIGMLVLSSYILDSDNIAATKLRIGVILFMFFVYEPIFTSYFCTLGQKITGIRIRKMLSQTRLSLIQAYIRIIVKIFLGIISFFTIPFSKDKRAIHDFAVGSIVIYRDQES
ncbi:MAG: RDD family protein [Desulfobacterales bacterium]|nr:RDD family protein [Desulfobacterales bacterium]